jgi:hypothetical protein
VVIEFQGNRRKISESQDTAGVKQKGEKYGLTILALLKKTYCIGKEVQ